MDNDDEFLQLARQCLSDGKLTLALQYYFSHFHNTRVEYWDEQSEKEFVNLLCDLLIFIRITPFSEELWKSVQASLSLFPKNWRLVNLVADIYNQYECHDEFAKETFKGFQIALENNISCLPLERKLLEIMWQKVPRWHFRMLNGKLRNNAYKSAIHKALEKGFTTALDIGAGCGLLSLYIGTHDSKPSVTFFESDETFYNLAILNLKNYCPNIIVEGHHSNSKDVQQIQYKSNLLVTEIFDVAVFGEGILSTLLHSYKYHIDSKNRYQLIPAKVKIFVTGIECESLDKQYRLHQKIECLNIDESVLVTKNMEEDKYDAENIFGQNFEVLTETTEIMELCFYEKELLESIYKNEWSVNLCLKGVKSGFIDNLIVWFDLHLDDDIMISTNPFHNLNEPCWEQAIFHCPVPLRIIENGDVTLKVRIQNEHLQFGNINETFLSVPHFQLHEVSLHFLNDKKWIEFLISLCERVTGEEQLTIFDFSTFPIIGLILAKKGHRIIHVSENPEDNFVNYLIHKNRINQYLFQSVHTDFFAPAVLGQDQIDYIFYEPCDRSGRLNFNPIENAIFKKFNVESFIPEMIVHLEVIHSTYLDYCNRVSEENVKPFDKLAHTINIFTGTEHPCLPQDFQYESITDEQKWNIRENPEQTFSINILRDASVNGILTWFTLIGLEDNHFCTKESTFFNLNAFLVPERDLKKNELLKLTCKYETGGFMKIKMSTYDNSESDVESNHDNSLKTFFSTYCSSYLRFENGSVFDNK